MSLTVSSNNNVIVFKGDDDSNASEDPYIVELSKLFFNTTLIPALRFEFFNLDILKKHLDSPELFSGIILSSPRCVQAVANCGSLFKWKNKKVFTVGTKTASLVQDYGVAPLGDDCGNAVALAEFIIRDYSVMDLPLLLPHGNLSLKTLSESLTKANMKVVEVEVYRTQPNPGLEDSLAEYFKKTSSVGYVVLMSPSAVKSCLPLLEKNQDLSTIKFVTLGPTTASALTAMNIVPAGVAQKPTPQHLSAILSQLCGQASLTT